MNESVRFSRFIGGFWKKTVAQFVYLKCKSFRISV